MKCPFVIKICARCKRILVANEMNFGKDKRIKNGLKGACKNCRRIEGEKYYKENKDEINKKHKQYYEENKDVIKERNKQYYEENKDEINKKHKQYYEENKDWFKEYHENYDRQYYEENKEKIKEQSKKYREENPHIYFNSGNKRRQLEENQGEGITKDQWLEMMEFFNWRCAYSGIEFSWHNEERDRSVDHIISLNKGGTNEIWNLVPMCMRYNNSKHTKDMLEWYQQQEFFSEERLNKIYEWIEYAKNKYNK